MADSDDSTIDINKMLQMLMNANQTKKRIKTPEEYEEKFKEILIKYVDVKDVDNVENFRLVVTKLHNRYHSCKDFALSKLLACKFPLLLVKALESLQSRDIFSNDDCYASVWTIYSLFYSASFHSESFSEELIESGFAPLFLSVITNDSNLLNFENDEKVRKLIDTCLGGMTNIIRVQPAVDYFKSLEEVNLKKALLKFIVCPNESISSSAAVILPRIVAEDEYNLLDCCCKYVEFFVKCVADALRSSNDDRCSSNAGVTYSLIEIIEALCFLSKNEKVKKMLDESNIVSLLMEIIEQQYDEKEVYFACITLYNLLQYKREVVVDVDHSKAILEKIKNECSQRNQILVQVILSLLNENDVNNQTPDEKSDSPSNWSELRVYLWLLENDAESCATKMQNVSGKTLEILHNMKVNFPETFNNALSEQFELTSDEASKFVDAFDCIEFS